VKTRIFSSELSILKVQANGRPTCCYDRPDARPTEDFNSSVNATTLLILAIVSKTGRHQELVRNLRRNVSYRMDNPERIRMPGL
jgi:hypothetical protein